jgi:hypothetical protein
MFNKISLALSAVILSLVVTAPAARADLLIEPYLGYMAGSWSQRNTSTSMSGLDYGARLGYQSLGFMVGVDYMSGAMTDKSSNPGSFNITPSDLGVFVGYKFPIMIRVYGVYNFMSDPKYTYGADTMKPDGSSYKLGLGFTALPFVVINLEYYGGTYTKDDHTPAQLPPNITTQMFGLSVSLPLTF